MTKQAEIIIGDATNNLLTVLGQALVNKAKYLCPVGQYNNGKVGGRLRGSITFATSDAQVGYEKIAEGSESDKIEQPEDSNVVRVGTAVEYGMHVEFGTLKQGAQSYLRQALHTTDIKGIIKKAGYG